MGRVIWAGLASCSQGDGCPDGEAAATTGSERADAYTAPFGAGWFNRAMREEAHARACGFMPEMNPHGGNLACDASFRVEQCDQAAFLLVAISQPGPDARA